MQNQLQRSSQKKDLMDWCTVNSEAVLQTNRLKKCIFMRQQDNSGMKFILFYNIIINDNIITIISK